MNIDILLVQEVRTGNVELLKQLANELRLPYVFYNLSQRSGQAGVAVLSRIPSNSQFIPNQVLEHEGRVLVVDFNDFSLVNLYSPYIGQDKVKLDKRSQWESDILRFLTMLKSSSRKIIVGGDLNVAPTQYDRYRVSKKQPGCSDEERDMYNTLVSTLKLRDAYREVRGDRAEGYTWGIHEGKLRLDFFLVDESDSLKIIDCLPIRDIHLDNTSAPSDHYPVLMSIQVQQCQSALQEECTAQ